MAAGAAVIYALCEPSTGECRYIGKTSDLPARIRGHLWEAQSSIFHTHKVNWLRTLSSAPLVKILEEVNEDTWPDAERRWIADMMGRGVRLTNLANGGQSSPVEGKGHTEESKTKMRLAALRNSSRPPSREGQAPWNKGLKGVMKANITTFKRGQKAWNNGIRKLFCKNGHMHTSENTRNYLRPGRQQVYQICKICERENMRRYLLKEN